MWDCSTSVVVEQVYHFSTKFDIFLATVQRCPIHPVAYSTMSSTVSHVGCISDWHAAQTDNLLHRLRVPELMLLTERSDKHEYCCALGITNAALMLVERCNDTEPTATIQHRHHTVYTLHICWRTVYTTNITVAIKRLLVVVAVSHHTYPN